MLVQADAGPYALAHSWVELPEGIAYDATAGGSYDLTAYRSAVGPIRRERRYSHREVAEQVAAHGRFTDYRKDAS